MPTACAPKLPAPIVARPYDGVPGQVDTLRAAIGTRTLPALGEATRTIKDVSLKGPALIARDAERARAAAAATAAAAAAAATRPDAGNGATPSENMASTPTP